ncbi:MAG: radical SAM protein [Deltaproteobacteria bacterium]|nr:radical SAM protein [Deltaproteobacteria bacterium]
MPPPRATARHSMIQTPSAPGALVEGIDIDQLVRDGILNRDEAEALRLSHQAETGTARLEALPSTAGDTSNEHKDLVKEAAAHHKRHWVRVTRLCNQRCTFCLDSMNQDGTMIDVESLKAYILLGRKLGRQRLILSGGEASVHPKYIDLIRYGRQVGYEWIQTVTNGMMFSYQRFAKAAAEAGLNEATVSMHGHTAQLHDRLTGTPGAFVTGIKGMQNLQATGKVVVNVDVVINKQNYKVLPDIIAYYYNNLNIREFDLLHIVPFGRGFDEHRHSLFFDLNDAVPYFRKAFAWADKPDLYLWTNRLPVTYLEGAERLIQDPHKLLSEFDGGRHNFEGYLKRGLKPDCHGERCDYCFLDGPCRQTMFPYREALAAGSFPAVRRKAVQLWAGTPARDQFERQAAQWVTLVADSAQQALAALPEVGFAQAALTLALPGVAEVPAFVAASPRPLARCLLAGADQLQAALAGAVAAPTAIEVRLDRAVAQWLLAHRSAWAGAQDRLVAALPNHETLSASKDGDPDPATLRAIAAAGVRLKNVPRCVAGAAVEPGDHGVLDAAMLDAAGDLDLDKYVAHYTAAEYYAKSVRCGLCAHTDRCQGLHINYVRNVGLGLLSPLDAHGQPVAGGHSFDQLTERLQKANAARAKRDQQKQFGVHKPVAAVAELSIGQP